MSEVTYDNYSEIYDEDTLKKIKEYGIFVKGTTKSFTIFLILWFLSKKDMHGYLIMKKIDEFFTPQIEEGFMKETKANKIYPLLKSLTESGLIEFYSGIHKKKKVKIYRLTDEGQKTLKLIKTSYQLNTKRKVWKEILDDLNN